MLRQGDGSYDLRRIAALVNHQHFTGQPTDSLRVEARIILDDDHAVVNANDVFKCLGVESLCKVLQTNELILSVAVPRSS